MRRERLQTNGTVKKRRRIRWSRMLLVLILLFGFCGTIGWGAYSVYHVAKDAYARCLIMIEDFQKKQDVQIKFQDKRFEQYTNILILGTDEGNPDIVGSAKNSDTILIASIKHQTGEVKVLAIPGETIVNIPGRQGSNPIHKSYYYGGTQLAVRTVEEFLNIPINHFWVIDWKAFVSLVDAVGGIELYVEHDMDYEDPNADCKIHLKKGYQHLDGSEAGQYVRYRGDELGDIGRVQRQQRFIKAFMQQLLQMDTIGNLPQIVEVMNQQMSTSMAVIDAAQLAKNLVEFRLNLIKPEMLPGEFVTVNGATSWKPNPKEIENLLNDMFPVKDEKNL